MTNPWPLERGWMAAYFTDHAAYADAMTIRSCRHMATYSKDRREFGWQLRFPARCREAVERCLRRERRKARG